MSLMSEFLASCVIQSVQRYYISICIQILSRESSTLSDSSYTVFLKLLDLSIHPHAKNEKKIVSQMTHISIEFSHRSRSSCYDHLQSLWKVRVGLNQDYNRLKATLKKKVGFAQLTQSLKFQSICSNLAKPYISHEDTVFSSNNFLQVVQVELLKSSSTQSKYYGSFG